MRGYSMRRADSVRAAALPGGWAKETGAGVSVDRALP